MPSNSRVLVVGSSGMDIILRMENLPDVGSLSEEKQYRYAPGGTGVNVSLMLSRLGYEAVLCSRVGGDSNGKWLTELLRRRGIDTRFIFSTPQKATGMSIIIAPEKEPNRTVCYPCENDGLTKNDVESTSVAYPDAVFVQLSMPADAVNAAVDYAKRKKKPLFVFTGSKPRKYPIENLEGCRVFITNQDAVTFYTGISSFKYDKMVEVGVELSKYFYSEYYVIKLNNGNTLIYDNTSVKLQTPPAKVVPFDPVASFDAFAAALTASMLNGDDIDHASRFAGVVEVLAKQGEGSSRSLPKDLDTIREYMRENEINPEFFYKEKE